MQNEAARVRQLTHLASAVCAWTFQTGSRGQQSFQSPIFETLSKILTKFTSISSLSVYLVP